MGCQRVSKEYPLPRIVSGLRARAERISRARSGRWPPPESAIRQDPEARRSQFGAATRVATDEVGMSLHSAVGSRQRVTGEITMSIAATDRRRRTGGRMRSSSHSALARRKTKPVDKRFCYGPSLATGPMTVTSRAGLLRTEPPTRSSASRRHWRLRCSGWRLPRSPAIRWMATRLCGPVPRLGHLLAQALAAYGR
jgi:hypothetical protein